MKSAPESILDSLTYRPTGALTLRKGRPCKAITGHVEERLLASATDLFLQYGYANVSLGSIVRAASTGKTALYRRYHSKEAIFLEVVARKSKEILRPVFEIPQSGSLTERLAAVSETLLSRLLSDDVIGLLRIVVADATRARVLFAVISEAGRIRGIEALTNIIDSDSPLSLDSGTRVTSKLRSRELATMILDALVAPMIYRALLGENLELLRSGIGAHIAQTLAVFITSNVSGAH